MKPCPLIWSDNPILKLVLPSTTTIKWINPTKHTTKGRIFLSTSTTDHQGGLLFSLLIVTILLLPHRLTFPLMPPWNTASSTSLFFKGVCCTGDRHRAGVDPGASRPPPPPGSTLAVSLPENCIGKVDGYHDAPLRWIKFSTMFSLSRSFL